MRSIAINVGANTNEPGFRGPISGDGEFTYVPIPESEPIAREVPTYADIEPGLPVTFPDSVRDRPVHLDPSFPEYPCCDRYTYGDEHGVKAGPLSELVAGEYLFFYATLTTEGEVADWVTPEWGAYLIGHFELAADPVTDYDAASPELQAALADNAHRKRVDPDARVLLLGDPEGSALYDRAVPLSTPQGGTNANRLVTELSSDSGKGPWWRRPLRFDGVATETLLEIHESGAVPRCFADDCYQR